jgi:hypothetical protein
VFNRTGQPVTIRDTETSRRSIIERHKEFFQYYATDDEMQWDYYTVRGLALPKEVLQKVFYDNIVQWLPGADKAFQK